MKLTPQERYGAFAKADSLWEKESKLTNRKHPNLAGYIADEIEQALSEKLSKLTPEGLREEIDKLFYGWMGANWDDVVKKEYYPLLNSQIEQAVTKERERIATWGNEACPHVHNVLSIRPKHACAICWEELLKDGK